jgi:hypothetical protein
MKLLRTIRLDPSDTFVFDPPAYEAEWAVSGAFAFWDRDVAGLAGKTRSAFRSGFLGVDSLGWSTLVQIVAASEEGRAQLVSRLSAQLIAHFGAPDEASARAAAEDEIAFVESLCSEPQDTLIAVRRTFVSGEVREQFRTLRPRQGAKPTRAFSFFDVEGEEEEQPEKAVDLLDMAGKKG